MLHVLQLSLTPAICLLCTYKLMGRKGAGQRGNKEMCLFPTCSQPENLFGCGELWSTLLSEWGGRVPWWCIILLICFFWDNAANNLLWKRIATVPSGLSVCHYFVIPSPRLPNHSLPHKTWLKWTVLNLIKKQCVTLLLHLFHMPCDGLL